LAEIADAGEGRRTSVTNRIRYRKYSDYNNTSQKQSEQTPMERAGVAWFFVEAHFVIGIFQVEEIHRLSHQH